MNKHAFAMISLCATTLLASNAVAQQTKTLDLDLTGVTIKGGVYLPTDGNTRNFSKSFNSIGFEFSLPASLLSGGETYVSIDGLFRNLGADRGTIIPITINQRWYGRASESGRRTYFFGGVGGSFIDINASNLVFTARFGAGVELSTRTFFETAGYVSDDSSGFRANGIGIYFGYRF